MADALDLTIRAKENVHQITIPISYKGGVIKRI